MYIIEYRKIPKKSILVFIIIFINGILKSQDLNNNRIGIDLFGCQNVVANNDFNLSKSFHTISGYQIGLTYVRLINDNIHFETGIQFTNNYFRIDKSIELFNNYWKRLERKEVVGMPFSLILQSSKGYFISSGVQIDVEVNHWTKLLIDDQSGIGFILSAGRNFHVSENLYMAFAPTCKIHSLVPISNEKVIEYGFKMNLLFGFLK